MYPVDLQFTDRSYNIDDDMTDHIYSNHSSYFYAHTDSILLHDATSCI